ncbi:MAG: DUF5110 domain-containing protein [Lachnospiraceae bacterium]|nr:DUF5110 domain-containing protein [Lachnospiraceae bacterium]
MKSHLRLEVHPEARKENMICGENYRVTVLTKSLVRVEYSAGGNFTDAATQTVLNRDFSKVDFTYKESEEELEVHTEYFQLFYNKKEFTSHGLSLACLGMDLEGMPGGNRRAWHYGEKGNSLKGTARTLDNVNGVCELEEGLMSFWSGCVSLDDSHTLLLGEDGWVESRKCGIQDIYLFAYGHRYLEALKDFYYLCGKTPMLPRFALGNWWSRYYPYTEESYGELMDRFDDEKIPFSVAVIDMDWHLVEINPKYGTGWTGYTWNRKLFPDPERFLKGLHDRGMKTTLNVHPADGIRAHEECYTEVADAMGIDASKEEPVNFDIADPAFLEVYLEKVHHPLEEQGVDFWWLDWQQGANTKVEGLDPLWMLNHYHFLDSGRNGRRPMTFSRYAGAGSHRYPIGFSGDTVISWESLDFQPYFTSTASNIGYGWWSHDIGGHMMGEKNDELEARWYQFGVFSPINRLHSSNSIFNGKEPWRFKKEVCETMKEFLRLRHQMIPYLYTMNYRAWDAGAPLCQPLYYQYPGKWEAYLCKNQYFFGSELMVAPVTVPCIAGLNVAEVKVYLPKGLWFDFFTDVAYEGEKNICMYRDIHKIPVLARAGAIIPMTEKYRTREVIKNPEELVVQVYPGADNTFTLYEDDNVSDDYLKESCVKTQLCLDWEKKRFKILPAEGNISLVPAERDWKIRLHKIMAADAVVLINGEQKEETVIQEGTTLTILLQSVRPQDTVEIVLPQETTIAPNPVKELLYHFLDQAEINFFLKERIYRLVENGKGNPISFVNELQAMDVDEKLQKAVLEIVGSR